MTPATGGATRLETLRQDQAHPSGWPRHGLAAARPARPACGWTPGLHAYPGFAMVEGMVGRIPILNVMPVVDLGRQPAKATVGEPFPVSATVFREGHDQLGAEVVLTGPDGQRRAPVRMSRHAEVPDRYDAGATPDTP